MKIPYLKIYPADILAVSRNLTTEQLGQAVLGICEQAFSNDTAYQPDTRNEQVLFELLTHWKEEAFEAYKQKRTSGRKGGKQTQAKNKLSDGSTACLSALSTPSKQPETETEPQPEPEAKTEKNILTAARPGTQGAGKISLGNPGQKPSQTLLEIFAGEAAERFEPEVKTPVQFQIWFKRNARCLRDILHFCSQNIPLALQTISVCAHRLQKAGITGGYEAVCRNLPEYYAAAKLELEDEDYAG